jgi:hypothetical protein
MCSGDSGARRSTETFSLASSARATSVFTRPIRPGSTFSRRSTFYPSS